MSVIERVSRRGYYVPVPIADVPVDKRFYPGDWFKPRYLHVFSQGQVISGPYIVKGPKLTDDLLVFYLVSYSCDIVDIANRQTVYLRSEDMQITATTLFLRKMGRIEVPK